MLFFEYLHSSKMNISKLNSQGDYVKGRAIGRLSGYEGFTLIKGISALIKGLASPMPASTIEDSYKTPSVMNRPSTNTESTGSLILDCPASRTERNTFLLFIDYQIQGLITAVQTN